MAHLAGRYANGGRFFWMKWRCAVPANSNNKWTPEEDKRLLKLQAAGKSSFLIAAELRRSVGAVHGRLSLLKAIERKAIERFASNSNATPPPPGRRRWTPDDDKRLMEFRAKGASFNEIANAIGRTEAAIEQRAQTLKRQAAAQRLWTAD
jgi:Myb-like DNA-binding protein